MTVSRPAPSATSLLTLEGPDALAFAHAQFTSDVTALATGEWQWSAWLDARGRVQCLLQLARVDEQTLLAMLRGGDAAQLSASLGRFVFRSRVKLVPQPAVPVAGGAELPAHRYQADGHVHSFGLGGRSMLIPGAAGDDAGWRLEAIRHGEPWLPDAFLGSLLPPALGLRRLGALSLDKGCYPGQEIVARLHYHGGHKYALAHLRLPAQVDAGASFLPVPPGGSAADPLAAQVLDCVPAGDTHEALAVLHESAFDELQAIQGLAERTPMLLRRFGS